MTEQGRAAENLTEKLNAARTALAALGSDRKEFLDDPVAPLLNQADEMLRTRSLPEAELIQLRQLRDQLMAESYYSDIIDTDEAAAILEVDPSRVRRLARQGLLGKSFTRTFVFHRSDVARFAKLHRPPGNPKQRE